MRFLKCGKLAVVAGSFHWQLSIQGKWFFWAKIKPETKTIAYFFKRLHNELILFARNFQLSNKEIGLALCFHL